MSTRRLAVVTGASGGIGRAICLRLAAEGYDLVAQYRSRGEVAESIRTEAEALGGTCMLLACDLASPEAVDQIETAVTEALHRTDGEVTALVNNAALLLGPAFETATHEDFDSFMAVNLRAPFFISEKLSRRMPPGSAIVNISSAGAHFSSPGDIIYAISKAALESMTFHSAEALANRGVRINAVIPGFTDNGHALFSIPEVLAHMGSHAVMGGVADSNVVAEAVHFLISESSSRTTGSVLDVSGGSVLGARPRTPNHVSLRTLRTQ